MKIVITGSEGTLGKPLVKELESRGHEVWRIDLQHQAHEKYIRADVSEYRQVLKAVEKIGDFDIMYHLAAEFGRMNGEEYFEQVWKSNVIGTRNILEVQKEKGFKLIFASSSEIYGELNDGSLYEDVVKEKTPRLVNDYAISKWVNEQQIINFQQAYDSEIMTLRFFNAYGPGEFYHPYRSVVCLFVYNAMKNLPYTVYENYHRVFMHIDDFIPTLANACERFKSGEVYNVGGTEYLSVREMNNMILEILNKDDSMVIYKNKDAHNTVNKLPDISKAVKDLSHSPKITLKEGLQSTIEWAKNAYGING